jgi:hypothetical protein
MQEIHQIMAEHAEHRLMQDPAWRCRNYLKFPLHERLAHLHGSGTALPASDKFATLIQASE